MRAALVSDNLILMDPKATLESFDTHLEARGLAFQGIAIGGVALVLMGVIDRATRDLDVLDPAIPEPILEAARSFALSLRSAGEVLRDDWLNNGPASLTGVLPDGWRDRLVDLFEGRALTLRGLGRADLLKTKLFALCDRGLDLPDCEALAPTEDELGDALAWIQGQDANPGWPEHVAEILQDLAQRLGHGV